MTFHHEDTIIALSTPTGQGAIGVIRLSGGRAIEITNKCFQGKNLHEAISHTVHFGKIIHPKTNKILDEVVITVFKNPKSYTGEDVIEISCHGSPYIISNVIALMIDLGARPADPGEFTMRAFINGKLDLSQAEAVADLIAAENQMSHEIALHHMKGGVTSTISNLRQHLIKFASLIELENDFSEEDVTFADRDELKKLILEIKNEIKPLLQSFAYGNAIKKGIPVAIVGPPNAGKSTLLNTLIQEEKAIVSPIPGTTRDVIEDHFVIEGITFRFIDTAGIRKTTDHLESIGIQRSKQQIEKAKIILYVDEVDDDYKAIAERFMAIPIRNDQESLILLNKSDLYPHQCHQYDIEEAVSTLTRTRALVISAKTQSGIQKLKSILVKSVKANFHPGQTVISNMRHYQALKSTDDALDNVLNGMRDDLPSDLMAIDIRHAMNALGSISGEIYTDDLLDSIFRDFCIGK